MKARERLRRCVRYSLYLFCLTVPLSIAGANIAWGFVLLFLLLYAAVGGRIPLEARHSALEKPLWLYLGVCLITSALGIDPFRSARFINQDAHKIWLYLLFSIGLAVDAAPAAARMLTFGFSLAAAVGIQQAVLPMLRHADPERAHAFVHPVVFGEQMAIFLLGACCFLLKSVTGATGRKSRVLCFSMLLLAATALFFSNTRAAFLAFAGGLAALFALQSKLRAYALAVILAAAGAFVAADRMRYDPLLRDVAAWREGRKSLETYSPLMRLVYWDAAWRMGKDHPWTGVGLNNYRTAFNRYYSGPLQGKEKDWGSAHNLYLHQFAERGLIGLGALTLLFFALWRRAFQRARLRPDVWNLWSFSSVTAFLIMNLTEVAWQTEILWMLVLFIWLAAERDLARAQSSR